MLSTIAAPSLNVQSDRSRRFRGSLRTGIIAAFVVLGVVPLAVALTSAVSRSSTNARQQVVNQLESIAEAKTQNIEYNLEVEQNHLHEFFADPTGQMLVTSVLSPDEPDETARQAASDYLTAIQLSSGTYQELFIYDLRGEILSSSDPVQVGKVIARQPYFEAGLAGDYVQPPFYEVSSQELNIILARPILNATSEVIGGLAGRLDLDQLETIMGQNAGLGETGETYLVSLENSYFVTSSRFPGYTLTHSYHSDGIDRALAGESGTAVYDSYRGETVIGAYRWLPGLQVALLAEMSQDEALSSSRTATRASIAIAIATAAIAVILGFVLAVRITQPITRLTLAAQELSTGNLDVRVADLPSNEIGELGQTFNSMAGDLQATVIDLEVSAEEARRATLEAQAANRAKDLFLATMSHELRTPLNAIIGFLGLMLFSEQLDEDNNHMAERSLANSERLLNLINNILDLSRISAGNLEITPVTMSPAHMLEAIRDDMSLQFKEKQLDFHLEMDPTLPEVIVHDEERLIQIATNLLGNALKFTDEGTISLSLTRSNDQMVLVVTDSGIGIPRAKQQLIFDEFAQVDSSSTRSHGGAGLGLAIVKRLAILMKGGVTVESETGRGSAFTVTLPLNLTDIEEEQALPLPAMQ